MRNPLNTIGYMVTATKYAHFEAPPASRKEPSAENASDVKHWPEVRLPAARRSDASRPPATSRRPSIVPWDPAPQLLPHVSLSQQYRPKEAVMSGELSSFCHKPRQRGRVPFTVCPQRKPLVFRITRPYSDHGAVRTRCFPFSIPVKCSYDREMAGRLPSCASLTRTSK